VVRVAVSGMNPDVDTPGDLAALAGQGERHAAPAAGSPALDASGPSNNAPHSSKEVQ
jgi:hypothetical protein